jgi:phenylalanyl-tRNA synthetase beta chain
LKFSYNWIRQFVPDLHEAPGPLERLITMKTAECEGVEPVGQLLAGACIARVESVDPIAHSHNAKALVDAGPLGRKTVVCGAPNCRPGMLTAWASIGCKLIDGVESDGMLASPAELAINKDHSGIIELDMGAPGDPLPRCAPDAIIEIDNKSITHRPDLWGHFGVAREVAAILGLKLRDAVDLSLIPSAPPAIGIQIEDFTLCPRYSALLFENVSIRPSPYWLQARLTAIGLNPINNIVDMTNFVMAELAQPMHAFDADLLSGGTIFIRPAKPGEAFRALNDEDYILDSSNLVIADAAGPIALGGVIGGAHSAIGPKTTRVVLESANFQASSIRKTSAAIKLRTDASIRFEKAQDPANTVRGLARAVELLREISPGIRLAGGLADQKREMPAPPPIVLRHDWLERKLGRTIPPAEVRRILESLEFRVDEPQPRVYSVSVPSWRATKDVSIPDDLVEEVGRMVGYDSITPVAPLVVACVPPANPTRKFQHEVRAVFVDEGFTEVYNSSFLSEESVRAFGCDPAAHLRVSNPIASDQALMRASLLPGIWKNVTENAKHRESFRLFEIGLEIHKTDSGLPVEIPHLAAALYERHGDGAAGLYEVKRAAECLMPGAETKPAAPRPFEHPARSGELVWRSQTVGRIFEFHPSLIESGRAAILDLDLRLVESLSARQTRYAPIRRYPSSAFDLSVVCPVREHAGTLQAAIASFSGPLLESIQFVRQYSGPPLHESQKSVSFRVTLGSAERTLSNDEVREVYSRVIVGMRARGYELRV